MSMPKRVKYRKQFRGSMAGKAMRRDGITDDSFGLVAREPCWIRGDQIEAACITLTRYTKRDGKIWIRIFPDKPVTVEPAEIRMGSGRGSTEYWVAVVKSGRVLFETGGVAEADARETLHLAIHKLLCKCKVASKEEVSVGMDGVPAVTAEGGERSEDE